MKHSNLTGVILAGGQASRMQGSDKGLIELAGKPMLEYVIAAIEPQVEHLLINVNRNHELYATYGFPLVPDLSADYQGPLAGMLSAMQVAKTDFLLCVPCDAPLLPFDLAARMFAALEKHNAELCVACDGLVMQPVIALHSCKLANTLSAYLEQGERKVASWLRQQHAVCVDFSDCPDAFINLNTPQQCAQLEQQIRNTRK